nr:hypothetical protein [Burkholderia sp. M701]
MNFQKKALLPLMLSTLFLLAACGGGGGGSDSNSQTSSTSKPAPSGASATSVSTALPSSASAPSSASSPVMAGEALPSLANPQPGSTASTGANAEGIWASFSGIDHDLALVDSNSNISSLTAVGTVVMDKFYGVISATPQAWTLTSGWDFSTVFVNPTTSGSGTYAPQKTFTGSYVVSGGTTNIAWTYDAANALSVTQESVAGTWSQPGTSMTIGNDGSLTGTLSGCNVSGTMLLTDAGTNHNMYTATISAAAGSTCTMPAGMAYTGNAAITFVPITGSNGYQRTILYSLKAADNLHVAYGQLPKQ